MIAHLDEHGQPCPHHPEATLDALIALAALGARMPTFHHDVASKLQSLVMALDEINELVDTNPDIRSAADTAHTALRELQQLLQQNRSLAKPPQRARVAIGELVRRGAERFGVKLRGDLPAIDVEVAPASAIHVVGTLLDVVAGGASLGRVVDVSAIAEGGNAIVQLAGPSAAVAKQPPNASATIAIATFVIARDGGSVSCASNGERFVLKLPIASA